MDSEEYGGVELGGEAGRAALSSGPGGEGVRMGKKER